jgi:peroxiredoxin
MSEDPIADYNYSTFTTSEARGKTKAFANAIHAGDEAPDFDLPSLAGGRVKLSQFRGEKYVVLQFGAIT